ncbi:MAG: M12 family metallo-peptidase [Pseudomonadota bacterium]
MPPGLFQAAASTETVRAADKAFPGQTRLVRINRGQLRSGRLYLNLGLAPGMTAELMRLVEHGNGSLVWIGRVAGDPHSTVTFAAGAESVAGTIRTAGRLFKLLPAGKGLHLLSEVPPGDPYPEMEPIPVSADDLSASRVDGDALPAADDGTTVDVLAVYTPSSMNRYGGVDGVESLIQLAIAETNQAYLNSGVATRLRLVHTALVDYTESGDMGTDLSRVTSPTDGHMDEVHALREQVAADTVTLIEESPDYCGIAWLMTSLSASFESHAFSVVYSQCATGYYSFGHELGHNMGSQHDHANASTTALFDYSYGWQDPDALFRTIMAYSCTLGCTRVQHFSNPAVSYAGLPTGVADYADNARSLNDTAYTVSNWRESIPLLPPQAPTGLSAVAGGADRIALSWTDNATLEDGFRLERAEAGGPFSEIAVLPADTVAYTDIGLNAETGYSYRIYAYNSAGVSADSNTASATTEAPPFSVDQTANGEIFGIGTVTGDYTDTWDVDGISEIIEERQSGGKPSNRHALLEHSWSFDVQPAEAVVVIAQLQTDAADGEAFRFAYSTDGQRYADMFTVTGASAAEQRFVLPYGVSGTLYVRVSDTQRTSGLITNYSIGVDQLLIRSETSDGEPPMAPSGTLAEALSSSEINLSWIDNADDEYGFELERSSDGGTTWALAASLPADQQDYTDGGLAPETGYLYRVLAFNGSGRSAYSEEAIAMTLPGAAIDLSAVVGKIRADVYVDLSWSGADSALDIYRDNALIAAAEANDGAYRDLLGKVKGTFVYQVCETGTASCSEPVSVTP